MGKEAAGAGGWCRTDTPEVRGDKRQQVGAWRTYQRRGQGALGSEAAAEMTCMAPQGMAASQCSRLPSHLCPGRQPPATLSRPTRLRAPPPGGGPVVLAASAEEWRWGDYVCQNNRNKGCFQASVCIHASQSEGIKNKHPPLFQSYVA